MENNENIVDAGDALAWTQVTTTNTETQDTLNNLTTIKQENDATQWWAVSEVAEPVTPPTEPVATPDTQNEKKEEPKDDEVENEAKPKEEIKEEEEKEEEKEEEEWSIEDDIIYIKNNPEAILKLIQDLQNDKFQNKWKSKYDLEKAEKTELEEKYRELQKQKYADKYDEANLPVLENKRPFWRSQNKFYADPENDANRASYIRRLEEELEDVKLDGKVVSIDEKETSKPEAKPVEEFRSGWLIWVSRPRR